jgi:hypothetical protein
VHEPGDLPRRTLDPQQLEGVVVVEEAGEPSPWNPFLRPSKLKHWPWWLLSLPWQVAIADEKSVGSRLPCRALCFFFFLGRHTGCLEALGLGCVSCCLVSRLSCSSLE